MTYEIIDDFLPQGKFQLIKNTIVHADFPWYMSPFVASQEETYMMKKMKNPGSSYFTHMFFNGFQVSNQCSIFSELLRKLEVKSLIRIKGNLYPSTEKIIHHAKHVDYDYEHRGAILYINTNDGLTVLEDGTEVKSIQNRLLLFDPSKKHNSSTCTDDKYRINVNFNFF